MIKNILFIFILSLIYSCNVKDNFDDKKGYYESRYNNGIPRYIKFYNNKSSLDGMSISLYEDGNIHSYIYLKNGKHIGPSMIYYPDGKLNVYDSYVDGKRDGISVHYNPSGILTKKLYYRNGLKDGKQYFFDYQTGDTIKIEIYDKGKLKQSIKK